MTSHHDKIKTWLTECSPYQPATSGLLTAIIKDIDSETLDLLYHIIFNPNLADVLTDAELYCNTIRSTHSKLIGESDQFHHRPFITECNNNETNYRPVRTPPHNNITQQQNHHHHQINNFDDITTTSSPSQLNQHHIMPKNNVVDKTPSFFKQFGCTYLLNYEFTTNWNQIIPEPIQTPIIGRGTPLSSHNRSQQQQHVKNYLYGPSCDGGSIDSLSSIDTSIPSNPSQWPQPDPSINTADIISIPQSPIQNNALPCAHSHSSLHALVQSQRQTPTTTTTGITTTTTTSLSVSQSEYDPAHQHQTTHIQHHHHQPRHNNKGNGNNSHQIQIQNNSNVIINNKNDKENGSEGIDETKIDSNQNPATSRMNTKMQSALSRLANPPTTTTNTASASASSATYICNPLTNSSQRTHPHLPIEPNRGCIEYKLLFAPHSATRTNTLITQLLYRIQQSPNQTAFYCLGVDDLGEIRLPLSGSLAMQYFDLFNFGTIPINFQKHSKVKSQLIQFKQQTINKKKFTRLSPRQYEQEQLNNNNIKETICTTKSNNERMKNSSQLYWDSEDEVNLTRLKQQVVNLSHLVSILWMYHLVEIINQNALFQQQLKFPAIYQPNGNIPATVSGASGSGIGGTEIQKIDQNVSILTELPYYYAFSIDFILPIMIPANALPAGNPSPNRPRSKKSPVLTAKLDRVDNGDATLNFFGALNGNPNRDTKEEHELGPVIATNPKNTTSEDSTTPSTSTCQIPQIPEVQPELMTNLIICKVQRCLLQPQNFPPTNKELKFLLNRDTDKDYRSVANSSMENKINDNNVNTTVETPVNHHTNHQQEEQQRESTTSLVSAPVIISPVIHQSIVPQGLLPGDFDSNSNDPILTPQHQADTYSNSAHTITRSRHSNGRSGSISTVALFGYVDDYGGNGCSLGEDDDYHRFSQHINQTFQQQPQTTKVSMNITMNEDEKSVDNDENKSEQAIIETLSPAKMIPLAMTPDPLTNQQQRSLEVTFNNNDQVSIHRPMSSALSLSSHQSTQQPRIANDSARIAQWFEFYLGLCSMTALFSPPPQPLNNSNSNSNITLNIHSNNGNTINDPSASNKLNETELNSMDQSDNTNMMACLDDEDGDDDFFATFASDF